MSGQKELRRAVAAMHDAAALIEGYISRTARCPTCRRSYNDDDEPATRTDPAAESPVIAPQQPSPVEHYRAGMFLFGRRPKAKEPTVEERAEEKRAIDTAIAAGRPTRIEPERRYLPEPERPVRVAGEPSDRNAPARRKCLSCGRMFDSAHCGNRMCVRCLDLVR